MKKLLTIVCAAILLLSMVAAHEEDEVEEGRLLVESKRSCDEATDDQLEAIGEYYMEQMHPGALHDAMHEVMGLEEGTQEHDDFHIALAKRMYCGEYTAGMMGGYGMMGYGNYGMMSMMGYGPYYSSGWWNWWGMLNILFVAVIFALVFWGVYKLMLPKKHH